MDYGTCGVPHTHPYGILCSPSWCGSDGPWAYALDRENPRMFRMEYRRECVHDAYGDYFTETFGEVK